MHKVAYRDDGYGWKDPEKKYVLIVGIRNKLNKAHSSVAS